jgi:hypothetical protein
VLKASLSPLAHPLYIRGATWNIKSGQWPTTNCEATTQLGRLWPLNVYFCITQVSGDFQMNRNVLHPGPCPGPFLFDNSFSSLGYTFHLQNEHRTRNPPSGRPRSRPNGNWDCTRLRTSGKSASVVARQVI